MYSPWASLKMFFFRSMIFRVPFYVRQTDNSISVLESCGWCQWRKWLSRRCLSSLKHLQRPLNNLSLSWLWGKQRETIFSKNPSILYFCLESHLQPEKKSLGSTWLPHLLKKFCGSKFPITWFPITPFSGLSQIGNGLPFIKNFESDLPPSWIYVPPVRFRIRLKQLHCADTH